MEKNDLEERLELLLALKRIIGEKIPELNDRFKEQIDLRMSLNKESDRGAVLLSVAYLENYLENALKSKLIGSQKHLKKLFEFNGALGTFSSKIDMSLSIGIINDKVYSDLNTLRKIRNKFAHHFELIDLASSNVEASILNLKLCPRRTHVKSSPRQIFISTIFFLIGLLQGITVKKEKITLDATFNLLDKNLEQLRNSPVGQK